MSTGDGLLLGLVAGLGAFCLWWSAWVPEPREERTRRRWATGLEDALVQAGVLVIAVLFVATNTLVDLLYGFLDPRIRYA